MKTENEIQKLANEWLRSAGKDSERFLGVDLPNGGKLFLRWLPVDAAEKILRLLQREKRREAWGEYVRAAFAGWSISNIEALRLMDAVGNAQISLQPDEDGRIKEDTPFLFTPESLEMMAENIQGSAIDTIYSLLPREKYEEVIRSARFLPKS